MDQELTPFERAVQVAGELPEVDVVTLIALAERLRQGGRFGAEEA